MFRKLVILPLCASLFFAQLADAEQITVIVKGMVCSFCAQGIKKTFERNSHVKNIKVDLDNKIVEVETDTDGALSDAEIKEKITDAGFDIVKIERKPRA